MAHFLSDEWIADLRSIILTHDEPEDFEIELNGGTLWNILGVLSLVPADVRAEWTYDRWDEIAKAKGTWVWS